MEDNRITQDGAEKPAKKRKKRVWLRIIIWLVIIVAVLAVTLFSASRIAGFKTVKEMLDWIMQSI